MKDPKDAETTVAPILLLPSFFAVARGLEQGDGIHEPDSTMLQELIKKTQKVLADQFGFFILNLHVKQ